MPVYAVFTVYTILAVSAVSAVESFQNRKIVQIQPYFIADITPLQGVFVHAELRCFSVCSVCAFLSGGACDIGYRHKVLPLVALIAPLYVGFGSLHFYVFGVNAVLAVGSVFAVCTVGSVFTVYAVFAVNTVLTVGTVRAVFTVCAVLTVFSGSATQLGKRHKVAPIGFIAVFPLYRRAVIPHLRQYGVALCRLAASGSKYYAKNGAKCNGNATDSFFHFSLPPFRYCERYLSANRATPCFKTSIWV